MIQKCLTCSAKPEASKTPADKYQDQEHGPGMRVFNEGKKTAQGAGGPVKCTVCGR